MDTFQPHPSTAQQDIGLRLEGIHLYHPDPSALRATLQALKVDHLATIHQGEHALSFGLATPSGQVTLD